MRSSDVNLKGVHCSRAVADTMIAQGSGVTLNASSVVGIYGNWPDQPCCHQVRRDRVHQDPVPRARPKGIRVNAVAPGFAATSILEHDPRQR